MNKNYLLTSIVLFAYIYFNQEYVCASESQAVCAKNEYMKMCGRICEATCENPNPKVCPKIACINQSSCSCKPNYLRDKFGCCVEPEKCRNACPRNEELKRGGKTCEPTCNDPCREHCPSVNRNSDYQCTCKKGYVRNLDGNCVKMEECRITQCGFNQTYTDCGSYCPKTCNPGKDAQIACPAVCVEGCFCSNGYVSSEKYGCILPEDCPIEEKCGINEEYNECGTACPKTCKNLGALIKCTSQCVEGCFCKDGYVKSELYGCVKPEECPLEETCTKSHEKYDPNGSLCQRTCKNFFNYTSSNDQTGPVCSCEQGYVRNDDGFCVLPEECPNLCHGEGQENEHYECGSACDTECGFVGEICPIVNIKCNEKCYCNEGYARYKGKCIPIDECPKGTCTKPNEILIINGNSCQKTCENYLDYTCTDRNYNFTGCKCKPGYVRDKDGFCVTPDECPKTECGFNQTYTECGSLCPKTCNPGKDARTLCPALCVKGCSCSTGYVSSKKYGCILPEDCPIEEKCSANEEYNECGTACPRTCKNLGPIQILCINKCVEGCFCKDGYVKSELYGCVKPEQCPLEETCTKNHEKYDPNGSLCQRTCKNFFNYTCSNDQTGPVCSCEQGYVRNDDGLCVLPEECPNLCHGEGQENEHYECGSACDTECGFVGEICPIVNIKCNEKCYCNEGYARYKGKCIPIDECPKGTCTKPNEILIINGNSCQKTCENYLDYTCTDSNYNFTGCKCKPGYVRDKDGFCVTPDECPKTECGFNQTYTECGSLCPKTCNPGKDARTLCPALCVKGCSCSTGYVSSEKYGCILPEDCPIEEKCSANEEYNECGTACPRTCKNLGPIRYLCINKCVEGCFCKDGYVKSELYGCVKPEQCPLEETCTKSHEKYDPNGSLCQRTCKNFFNYTCSNDQTGPVCSCEQGYVRNDDGLCVLPEECPNLCHGEGQENEHYACGSACDTECGFIGEICPIVNKKCNEKCYCDEGYARYKGKCIPIDECPKRHCRKPNEILIINGSSCEKTCENCLDYTCTDRNYNFTGCKCKPGYVRNKDGFCVTPDECPKKCSVNEEYKECGTACPKTCKNLDTQILQLCTQQCVKGCFCKDGYVKSELYGCVKPEQCPLEETCTKSHEKYDPNGRLCQRTCKNFFNYTCSNDQTGPVCSCEQGYVRNDDGLCVLPEECPNLCHGEGQKNEHYSCGSACDTECGFIGEICPIVNIKCNEKCYCDEGYARYKGKCIPIDECPKRHCRKPNEILIINGSSCQKTCKNCLDYTCTDRNYNFTGCKCKPGYVRNKDGFCVTPDECPKVE